MPIYSFMQKLAVHIETENPPYVSFSKIANTLHYIIAPHSPQT